MKIFVTLLRKLPTVPKPLTPPAPPQKSTIKIIINGLFGKYLLVTNTISSGLLMVAGDFMSQQIEYRKGRVTQKFDYVRSGKMFCVGAIQGPIQHYFYSWMDRAITTVNVLNVGKKIILDQLIMSPICILAFFYPAGMLHGQSLDNCTAELKEKFLEVYVTDCSVWPTAQFINFYYLAPKYRVVYVNFLTMLYNVYLSYVKHRDMDKFANSPKV